MRNVFFILLVYPPKTVAYVGQRTSKNPKVHWSLKVNCEFDPPKGRLSYRRNKTKTKPKATHQPKKDYSGLRNWPYTSEILQSLCIQYQF